jgi:polyhydroxyalkanoate synthesis repressor PhaR
MREREAPRANLTVIRLIKRYESRKLYDTEESRYVSLEEVASFVRNGQQVMVVESATDQDVTSQTLAQVILEEGRSGQRRWSPEMLHELLRRGERVLHSTLQNGADQVQHGVESLLRGSIGRLRPVREASDELERLSTRLEQLEAVLSRIEAGQETAQTGGEDRSGAGSRRRRGPSARRKKVAAVKKRAGVRGAVAPGDGVAPERPARAPAARRPARKSTTRTPGGET